jgi:hypothetical protein
MTRPRRADAVGGVRSGSDVDHVPSRVDRRFDPDDRGLGAQCHGEGSRLGLVEECRLGAMFCSDLADQILSAVIHDLRSNDVLALAQRSDSRSCGSEARTEQPRLSRAVKLGENRLGLKDGGISVS